MAETALTTTEALHLLGQVSFGRVIFTSRAMPAVRPVRHVLADGHIIIAAGPELALADGETIVAYQADQFDESGCLGWSVAVVGRARQVTGDAEASRYRALLPACDDRPGHLVAISTDMVTGFRLAAGPPFRSPAAVGR